ncbi:hypothetical protein [Tautonia rosea]|uniref:hypothetical protein n=1 Tax=Tautonia rosea TaxID=2728037 RepID=UPI0014732B8E|nr:hypothetical protein [Tautonia rosea]
MPDPLANRPAARPLRKVIAENPDARRRIGQAYAEFLAVVLLAIVSLTALVLWHLVRRGRVIRQRLGPPRTISWPNPEPPGTIDRDRDGDRTETPS